MYSLERALGWNGLVPYMNTYYLINHVNTALNKISL